jgi:hypothetical protein
MSDTIQAEILRSQMKSQHNTNHILHLLLCIPTAGFWVIVWALIVLRNWRLRSEVDDLFNETGVRGLQK